MPPQKLTYLTCAYKQGGGGVSVHSPEIGATLVRLFYNNIMITSATDIAQQFYTYWQIQDNKALLVI